MKKAYLVTFAPCTRVVVEENATEEEITEAARQQMCKEPEEYITADTCTYCEEDTASPYNAETDDVEPDQPILFHPLDIPAPPGGRGFFGLEKGERITNIDQMKVGDIFLKYSPQFNSNNVVKVIGSRTNPILRLTLTWWHPIHNASMGDTFSLAGYSLNDPNADEYYKPKDQSDPRVIFPSFPENIAGIIGREQNGQTPTEAEITEIKQYIQQIYNHVIPVNEDNLSYLRSEFPVEYADVESEITSELTEKYPHGL